MEEEILLILQECKERRDRGREKYGEGDFRNKNMSDEIREEFLDIINYAIFQLIKLKELDEKVKIYEKKKVDKRNKDITLVLQFLKKVIGISAFADSANERNIGKHMVGLIKNIGKDEFIYRLEKILDDDFKRKNCNRIKYLYGELKAFIKPKTSQTISDHIIS